jgi:hypothetical protein
MGQIKVILGLVVGPIVVRVVETIMGRRPRLGRRSGGAVRVVDWAGRSFSRSMIWVGPASLEWSVLEPWVLEDGRVSARNRLNRMLILVRQQLYNGHGLGFSDKHNVVVRRRVNGDWLHLFLPSGKKVKRIIVLNTGHMTSKPLNQPLGRRELEDVLKWADARGMVCAPPIGIGQTKCVIGRVDLDRIDARLLRWLTTNGVGLTSVGEGQYTLRSTPDQVNVCKLCLARTVCRQLLCNHGIRAQPTWSRHESVRKAN